MIYTPRQLYYIFHAWRSCRSLERKGLLVSYRDEHGVRRWKRTELGEQVAALIVTEGG